MKYAIIILSLIFLCSFSNKSSYKDKITSKEIYYMVNEDGTINTNKIVETRKIIYSRNREFISGTATLNKENINLTSDNSKYYKFPIVTEKMIYCEFDSSFSDKAFLISARQCQTTFCTYYSSIAPY